jgi:dTDP-glucose 4,6-dehydratase
LKNLKLLVTGGAGFIGSHFIRHLLANCPGCRVVNFDKLTYAGNLANVQDVANDPRYTFVRGDICDRALLDATMRAHQVEAIVNFAAETHVDRSIASPQDFLQTDIFGTFTLLEAVKEHGLRRYLQVSTDEVYGDWERGGFPDERAPLAPSSPYAASKAGADLQVLAYRRTYKLPVIITRCTNNYGPYQYPEKLLPLFITNLLEEKKVPVYGDGGQIRDWLYVEDHCRALALVLAQGQDGEVYNIGANQDPEVTNLALTRMVLETMGLGADRIDYVTDRKGHDRRYAVDCSKIKTLGWQPQTAIGPGLARTVEWYRTHRDWWKKIKSGEYKEYYKSMYSQRI